MFFVSNPHSVLQMQMRLRIKHHPSGLRLTFLKHHQIQFHPQATEPFFLYGGHGAMKGLEPVTGAHRMCRCSVAAE